MDQPLVAGGNWQRHRFGRMHLRARGKRHWYFGVRGQSFAGGGYPLRHLLAARGVGVRRGGSVVGKGDTYSIFVVLDGQSVDPVEVGRLLHCCPMKWVRSGLSPRWRTRTS